MNSEQLYSRIWYHGTKHRLGRWLSFLRTPSSPYKYFPADVFILHETAQSAACYGPVIKALHLNRASNILDAANDWASSERLRLEVNGHPLLKHTHNCTPEYWHKGWKTGSILNISVSNPSFEQKILQQVSRDAEELDKPLNVAFDELYLTLSREITAHILISAAAMGYDGLSGFMPNESLATKSSRFVVVFTADILLFDKQINVSF